MNNISSIVNFNKHPIDDINYIKKCNSLIKDNSLLVLDSFLTEQSLDIILKEPEYIVTVLNPV